MSGHIKLIGCRFFDWIVAASRSTPTPAGRSVSRPRWLASEIERRGYRPRPGAVRQRRAVGRLRRPARTSCERQQPGGSSGDLMLRATTSPPSTTRPSSLRRGVAVARPPLPPFTTETARVKVQGRRGRLEHPRPRARRAAYTEDSVWRNATRSSPAATRSSVPGGTSGSASSTTPCEGPVGLHRTTGSPCASSTSARRHRPVVAQLRQRAVGVRRGRAHAPARGQHQRRSDRRISATDPGPRPEAEHGVALALA